MPNQISDDGVNKSQKSHHISSSHGDFKPHIDNSLSSIEKSKSVKPELTPAMAQPILATPLENCEAFAIASVDAKGVPNTEIIYSFTLKEAEIKDEVLKGWMNNLREIEEYVRQLLLSPHYREIQELLNKGDQRGKKVSGVQGVSSANAAAESGDVEFISMLDRCRLIEKVSRPDAVSESAPSSDAARMTILPLMASILAGGYAIGSEAIHSASSLGGIAEMVEKLQPLLASVSIQDIVPFINLMVVGPIYYHSWNEAISNLKNKQGKNHLQLIHQFAKDVIKMVFDPNFIHHPLLQHIKGIDGLTVDGRERLSRLLKVVLIGVALSLLYSIEVGKIHGDSFGGIESEELRDLLLGKFKPESSKKLSEHEKLTSGLIERAWEQLTFLSIEDRTVAVEILLNYVSKKKDVHLLLEPSKVFKEVVESSFFETTTEDLKA